MKELLLASANANKIREIKAIIKSFNLKINLISLKDLKCEIKIKETGVTIAKNSLIKAKTLANKFNKITISDDSGLEIKKLNNFPGVYSKRWSYPIIDSYKQNQLLLEKCKSLKDRRAKIVTIITFYDPINNFYKQFPGIFKGYISKTIHSGNGFGFDTIFYLKEYKKTISQLSNKEKNKISNRFIALKKFINWYIKERKNYEK